MLLESFGYSCKVHMELLMDDDCQSWEFIVFTLHGLVTTHSDDLILAGDEMVERDIITKLQQMFKFSKVEKLGDLSDISVRVYADASYGNQSDKVRSTAGRVVLLENKKTGKVNVASWKTKKLEEFALRKICRDKSF